MEYRLKTYSEKCYCLLIAGLSTDEILANAMLFFIAGYDTTATTLSYFLYNMAVYPECQAKLIKEIDQVAGDKVSD